MDDTAPLPPPRSQAWRGPVRAAAGLVATIAFVVLLRNQFRGTTPDRAWLLGVALAVWWVAAVAPRGTAATTAWAVRGAALVGAALDYALVRPGEARLDAVLAGCAVVWLLAGRFGHRARHRSGGLAAAGAGVLLALVARYLGAGLAAFVFWVPAHVPDALRAHAGFLGTPLAWLVWPVWLWLVGAATGVLRSYEVHVQRVIRTTVTRTVTITGTEDLPPTMPGEQRSVTHWHAREHIHEDVDEHELSGPPPRTGLEPLARWRGTWGGWTSTSSTSSWSSSTSVIGLGRSLPWSDSSSDWDPFWSMSGPRSGTEETLTHEDGVWRVRLVEFPPAHVPFWADRPLAAWARRRRPTAGARTATVARR